jgi:choline-sulfatase
VPLLEGDDTGWDDEAISQFNGNRLMIKQGPLKYQYYGDQGPEVLFDLADDPGETRNLLGDPGNVDALRRFRARRDELGFRP